METKMVLEQLKREHHELNERVAILERKAWLSLEEDIALHRLKKQKLAKRDQIERLARVSEEARAT